MANRSAEIGGELTDKPRTQIEVVNRALALGAVVAVSFGAPRDEILAWLDETELVAALTPAERAFLDCDMPADTQINNMSWQSERLTLLLWALGKIDTLPPTDAQCNIDLLERILPPYGDQSISEFRRTARLRTEDELFDLAIQLQAQHALARQRATNPGYRPTEPAVDIEIIQERHHAINWLVGYSADNWDDVTTDT